MSAALQAEAAKLRTSELMREIASVLVGSPCWLDTDEGEQWAAGYGAELRRRAGDIAAEAGQPPVTDRRAWRGPPEVFGLLARIGEVRP